MVVAQLVRASDCDSEGRGFEPHHPPQIFQPHTQVRGFFLNLPVSKKGHKALVLFLKKAILFLKNRLYILQNLC